MKKIFSSECEKNMPGALFNKTHSYLFTTEKINVDLLKEFRKFEEQLLPIKAKGRI
jgi:hypothetical protein